MVRRGKLVVISGPSGSGKTSIARSVLAANPSLTFSVSATTRPKRAAEVEGRDYYFLSEAEFRQRSSAGEFVEWEELYGDCYGTLRDVVDGALAGGHDLLFDVDVRGGLSIKRQYPDALLIFIRPPDLATLEARLRGRQTEDAATLRRRLDRVPMELALGENFDHTTINDDLVRATAEVQGVVERFLQNEPL